MKAHITSGQWTTGVLVGFPIAVLVILCLIIVMALFTRAGRREARGYADNRSLYFGSAIACGVAILAILVGVGIGSWPWKAEYHQYRPVHGQVATISNRFVGSDKSTSQKFVVTFVGNPQQYGINDTRASLLKAGDELTIRCIRVYEYGSNNAGYDCKWGQ